MLNLDRPIVVFDLIGTSRNASDARVIQVAMRRFEPRSNGMKATKDLQTLVDPGVQIPTDVQENSGITDSDVQGAPYFVGVTKDINALVNDADLVGYRAMEYSYPLLNAAFREARRTLEGPDDRQILDIYELEDALEDPSLVELTEKYADEPLEDDRDAMARVDAVVKVLEAQLDAQSPSSRTLNALGKDAPTDRYSMRRR